ncbi:MAG: aminotransferase class I/II-fold pyridoxal phosphate-dependent enzyme [Candidatus Thorarchaeota archaeon]|nr:aminotransferase class I/II-fold pyridoxal phosphate-dependent enzyme [Candidatus Thorarchaeota archaeon]
MTRDPTGWMRDEYNKLVEQNFDWKIRELQGPSTPIAKIDGKEVIMLCSNNYLNLSNNPKMKEAALEAIKSHGVGSGSVRAIAGTMDIHLELERRLANFKGAEASLTYSAGFTTNEGLIPQLVTKEDAIISDELNHGSIIDGVRLTKAKRFVYKHNNVADLERVLADAEKENPKKMLVITDGVFSMDGDIAPLDGVVKAAEPHGAMIYVDDAHGEAVLGKGGRGIVSHFNLTHKQVHFEMGTFSKAFGVMGGHVAGSRDMVNYALNKSRSWLLSGSHPPATAAACIAAIDILETEEHHVKNLWENREYFVKGLQQMGFDTGFSQTPIIPAMTGESSKAVALSDGLFKEGILALPIVFPMVARDKARIRNMMTSGLSMEQLDIALAAYEKVGKQVGII